MERYGIDEIAQWPFEVWNEPNTMPTGFWGGTQAEYFELYRQAALALKRVSPRLRVGGPATCAGAAWIADLKAFCTKEGVPLDFITTHTYTGANDHINDAKAMAKDWDLERLREREIERLNERLQDLEQAAEDAKKGQEQAEKAMRDQEAKWRKQMQPDAERGTDASDDPDQWRRHLEGRKQGLLDGLPE